MQRRQVHTDHEVGPSLRFAAQLHFYIGLIVEPTTADSPEVTRKMKQVTREIEKAGEAEYDAMNAGRTEKDKDDERRFKAGLSAFAET